MSSSTQLEHYDVPSSNPLETPTFSFRVGKHLGRFFVAAKNKATDKYKQVTSGIIPAIIHHSRKRLFLYLSRHIYRNQGRARSLRIQLVQP